MIEKIAILIDLYEQEIQDLELIRNKKNDFFLLKREEANNDLLSDTMELLFYYKEIEKLKSKIEVLNKLLI
jgi:hypothetical protein